MGVIIKPDTIAFLTTTNCTAECKMCCFSCSPLRNENLSNKLMKDIILQAEKLNSIKTNNINIRNIGFTGGEVFTRFPDLLELTEYAYDKSFHISATTNGFWGGYRESTNEKLDSLKKVGLSKLSLSCDNFHQEYVPMESIKNIIIAAKDLDIQIDMGSIITKSTSDISYIYKELKELMIGIVHYTAACLPVGAAEKNIPREDFIYNENLLNNSIKCFETTYFAIYEDGEIFSCCSQAGRTEPLSIGNINSNKLNEINENYYSNIHLRIIKKMGLSWYLNIAKELEYNKLFNKKYVNKCDLCRNIFIDKEFMKLVKPYTEAYEEYIYQKYLKKFNNE